MKRMSINRILVLLVTATIFFVACTKENPEVKLDPKLSTSQVLNVKSDSATVVGFVEFDRESSLLCFETPW